MSKPDTWMPWYVADFLIDTTKLNDAESGSYALLLMHLWNEGGRLPDVDEDLARYARCDPKEWGRKRRARLECFFIIRDGWWYQKRLSRELVKATNVYESKVENGRRGGRPPKPIETESKPDGSVSLNPTPNRDETQPQPQVHTTVSKKQETVVNPKAAASPLPDWLPPEEWAHFERHRVAIKARLTERARVLLLRELGALRERGCDPVAVIEQSIARGWKGLFEVKGRGNVTRLSAVGQRTAENLQRWIEEGEQSNGTEGP